MKMNREEKITQVKNAIKSKFKDKKFTTGDLYYAIESKYDKSKFCTIRNIAVKLTMKGFLDYIIEVRGSPHYDSETRVKGATFTLSKNVK